MSEKYIENIETLHKVTIIVSQKEKYNIRKLFSDLQNFVYDNKNGYDDVFISSLRENLQSLINLVDSIK